MDNLTGEGKWFQQDIFTEEEKGPIETKKFTPIRNVTLLKDFTYQCGVDHREGHEKHVGDALVHLNAALKLLE